MNAGDWYLALLFLGAGTGIPLFWFTPRGRAVLREPGREVRFHLAAEVATGLALVVAGAGLVVARAQTWVPLAGALGLGMLTYTLIASPGRSLDRGDRRTVLLLGATAAATIPAMVLLFTR